MRFVVLTLVVIAAFTALVALPRGGSQAAWPGENGRIVYRDEVNGGIWIMNADGSGRQPVTTGDDYYPSWSPDGSKIVFERRTTVILGVPTASTIWTVNPDGTDVTMVGPGSQPSWSPDGSRIVYSMDGDIHEMDADGSDDVEITSPLGTSDSFPVYRPDGTVIAFLRQPAELLGDGPGISGAGGTDIWTVSPDGLGGLQLTNTPGESEGPPDWSPDGNSLVYSAEEGIVVSSFPANVPQTILAAIEGSFYESPVFSPDGATIAFALGELLLLEGGGTGPAITPTEATINTIPAGGGPTIALPGGEAEPSEYYPDWEPATAPTPTPTQGPIERDLVWGDNQCDDDANSLDALVTLRFLLLVLSGLNGCPSLGTEVDVVDIAVAGELEPNLQIWSDVNCDSDIDEGDVLGILRNEAGLDVDQEAGCPPIGADVTVQYGP